MSVSPASPHHHLFKIRTICAFVSLTPEDFPTSSSSSSSSSTSSTSTSSGLQLKLNACRNLLDFVSSSLAALGYEVQTLRVATNPFEEYLDCESALSLTFAAAAAGDASSSTASSSFSTPADRVASQLDHFASALRSEGITFVSLGPCRKCSNVETMIPRIVLHSSSTFSVSADCPPCDLSFASVAAKVVKLLSQSTPQGIGNFRFCSSSRVLPNTPFFPCAYSSSSSSPDGSRRSSTIGISIGFENGPMANEGLRKAKTIDNVGTVFKDYYTEKISPVAAAAAKACSEFRRHYMNETSSDPARPTPPFSAEYLGLDVSLNPSLGPDNSGSVAAALECLDQVSVFGRPGTMAAAAAVTTAIQSIPLTIVGYCGIMLPACEDRRLSALASAERGGGGGGGGGGGDVTIGTLMNVSAVCGVGVDTVPIAGDVDERNVAAVILDVAALAARWNKPLSCRLFPVPGRKVGEWTEFESEYLCNCKLFDC